MATYDFRWRECSRSRVAYDVDSSSLSDMRFPLQTLNMIVCIVLAATPVYSHIARSVGDVNHTYTAKACLILCALCLQTLGVLLFSEAPYQ